MTVRFIVVSQIQKVYCSGMRKLVVLSFISLDGVMQAPGGRDEDTSNGFKFGGWTVPFWDEASAKIMGEQMGVPFDLLLGRKTYDLFADYWPKHEDGLAGQPFKKAKKYVVSNNADLPLPWDGSYLIHGDVVDTLKSVKDEDGPMLQVHGSGKLVQTLLKNDLVDELWLKIYPVTLGGGQRLFAEGTIPATFELTKSEVSPKGVIYANYSRAGEVETGTF
jgi:dihydrofolate reductase